MIEEAKVDREKRRKKEKDRRREKEVEEMEEDVSKWGCGERSRRVRHGNVKQFAKVF